MVISLECVEHVIWLIQVRSPARLELLGRSYCFYFYGRLFRGIFYVFLGEIDPLPLVLKSPEQRLLISGFLIRNGETSVLTQGSLAMVQVKNKMFFSLACDLIPNETGSTECWPFDFVYFLLFVVCLYIYDFYFFLNNN